MEDLRNWLRFLMRTKKVERSFAVTCVPKQLSTGEKASNSLSHLYHLDHKVISSLRKTQINTSNNLSRNRFNTISFSKNTWSKCRHLTNKVLRRLINQNLNRIIINNSSSRRKGLKFILSNQVRPLDSMETHVVAQTLEVVERGENWKIK